MEPSALLRGTFSLAIDNALLEIFEYVARFAVSVPPVIAFMFSLLLCLFLFDFTLRCLVLTTLLEGEEREDGVGELHGSCCVGGDSFRERPPGFLFARATVTVRERIMWLRACRHLSERRETSACESSGWVNGDGKWLGSLPGWYCVDFASFLLHNALSFSALAYTLISC